MFLDFGINWNSQSDVEVNNYLTSCVIRPTDEAYVARFPWRTHHPPPLPSNYTVAECRAQQLARRLATNPKLLLLYHQIITDQETRGVSLSKSTHQVSILRLITFHTMQ